ncbi:hypothetical protein [Micromonospora sp. DT31]|uniref:hypothetical protein n=1 Tax=Micromonospora sp. DT31 TaxID=3393434 RepID=UPI003CEE017D
MEEAEVVEGRMVIGECVDGTVGGRCGVIHRGEFFGDRTRRARRLDIEHLAEEVDVYFGGKREPSSRNVGRR